MAELVSYETDGAVVLVEVDEDEFGVERVTRRRDGILESGRRLEEVLATVKPTVRAVISALHELTPDEHEVEFGLKLNAEAGAIVAKTAVEGHFIVRMRWKRASGQAST